MWFHKVASCNIILTGLVYERRKKLLVAYRRSIEQSRPAGRESRPEIVIPVAVSGHILTCMADAAGSCCVRM
jgi:hypothetical protein